MKETKFEYAGIQVTLTPVAHQTVVSHGNAMTAIIRKLTAAEAKFLAGLSQDNPFVKGPIVRESDNVHDVAYGVVKCMDYEAGNMSFRIYPSLVMDLAGGFSVAFSAQCRENEGLVLKASTVEGIVLAVTEALRKDCTRHKMLIGLGIIPKDTPEPQGD
jgi:hypothetical protein